MIRLIKRLISYSTDAALVCGLHFGQDVTMTNKEGMDRHHYASYNSPEESFNAWVQLMHNPRYQAVLNAKSVPEAAAALQQAGYATDPHYARELVAVNNRITAQQPQQVSPQVQSPGFLQQPTAAPLFRQIPNITTPNRNPWTNFVDTVGVQN